MPLLPVADKRVESLVVGTMDVNGRLAATIERKYFGQAARPLRATGTLRGSDERKKAFERGLSARLGAMTLNTLATRGDPEEFRHGESGSNC
jgi:hypothetical protein